MRGSSRERPCFKIAVVQMAVIAGPALALYDPSAAWPLVNRKCMPLSMASLSFGFGASAAGAAAGSSRKRVARLITEIACRWLLAFISNLRERIISVSKLQGEERQR